MWLHLVFLTIATLLTWVWTNHPQLSFYNLQLIAALIILYFLKNLKIINHKTYYLNRYLDTLVLTIIVLLLVFSTGGLSSPLFFLFYFLLFGISFLFEPLLSIAYSFVLIIFLTIQLNSPQDLLKVFSLVFVAPLALFFGQQYLQNLVSQKRIKVFQKKWLGNEKSLESEETKSLLWLSLNFHRALAEILEITAQLLSDISRISPTQKSLIKKIRRKTKKLLKEGKRLQRFIDRETD